MNATSKAPKVDIFKYIIATKDYSWFYESKTWDQDGVYLSCSNHRAESFSCLNKARQELQSIQHLRQFQACTGCSEYQPLAIFRVQEKREEIE